MNNLISHLELDSLTKQKDLAAKTIGYSADIYDAVITTYNKLFRYKELHASFVNNLKDAIIHFQKFDSELLKISSNSHHTEESNLKAFVQFELLSEHLTRGVVDAYVEMLQYAARFYEMFLNCLLLEIDRGVIFRSEALVKRIRTYMHFCKKSVLELRTSKIDLIRIVYNQPVGLNDAFLATLQHISSQIKLNYDDLLERLQDVNIYCIYNFVMNACENGLSLYRIKSGDKLEDVAKATYCSTYDLKKLNNLNILDHAVFPNTVTWLYHY